MWLVDRDYAGFNSPLFDPAGLASNIEPDAEQGRRMLERHFGTAPDADLPARLAAMKCAALLREALRSMTSEMISHIDFDCAAHTAGNLERFERAWEALPGSHGRSTR